MTRMHYTARVDMVNSFFGRSTPVRGDHRKFDFKRFPVALVTCTTGIVEFKRLKVTAVT